MQPMVLDVLVHLLNEKNQIMNHPKLDLFLGYPYLECQPPVMAAGMVPTTYTHPASRTIRDGKLGH
jgi:hypothetical protein